MATFEQWSVVVVPFPFTDIRAAKRRPALVISNARFGEAVEHGILAMITSSSRSRWPSDVALAELSPTGLRAPSLVRMKLFTLDHRLILRRIGRLGEHDQRTVEASLRTVLGP